MSWPLKGAQYSTDPSGNWTGFSTPSAGTIPQGDFAVLTKTLDLPLSPFCEMLNGAYLCTDKNADSARRLYSYTGDITLAPSGGTTSYLSTWSMANTSGSNGIKTPDGTINLGGSGPYFQAALQLNSGAVIFASNGASSTTLTSNNTTPAGDFSNNTFLFRAAPTTYTLGNDASGTNQKAVLAFGTSDGLANTGTTRVRLLHARGICEAVIQTTPGAAYTRKVLVGEYNVNGSRTPGGANDGVRLWVSTDDALTFSALLTFNTAGVNIISHIHAVIQDPYTRLIYILTGDYDNGTYSQNAIIVWDGISAAPAANSSLATIAATPGWGCIYGSELDRYGDFIFAADGIYALPDSDTENQEAWTSAFSPSIIDRNLKWVSAGIGSFERYGDLPPVIACALRKERRRGVVMAASSTTVQCRGHNLRNGAKVLFVSTETLPSPLTAGTVYYWTSIDANGGTVSATRGGGAITFTNVGAGNISMIIDYGLTGGYLYASLNNAGVENYFHFWSSVNGKDWAYVAKVKNRAAGQTGMPRDFWQDKDGNIIAGARYGQGVDFSFVGSVAQSASAVLFSSVRCLNRPAVQKYD